MNETLQNTIVLLLFIFAIWNLAQHFHGTLKNDGCSDACGSCSTSKKDITKLKVKKLNL